MGEKVRKLGVVEDVEMAAGGDLADSVGVPAVPLVAVLGLNEDGAITETDRVYLSLYVLEVDSFTWNK